MEEELFNPFNKIFLAFKVFGMWQDGRQSWTYFILGYLNHIIGMELCLLGEIIRAYKDTGFEDFIETAGIILTYTSGVLKSINFVYKLKIIQKTFDALRELVKFTADDRWKNREQLKARISFGLSFRSLRPIHFSQVALQSLVSLRHRNHRWLLDRFSLLDSDVLHHQCNRYELGYTASFLLGVCNWIDRRTNGTIGRNRER
jgi:hypothetical protein